MIAVNPVAPDNLIGVSMGVGTAGMTTVAVVSRDGGRTWHESPIPECGYDPWIAFLPSGVALMSCLPSGTGPDPVLVFRSENGGVTWEGPTELPVGDTSFDHSTLVVDTTDSARRGTVYLVSGHVARPTSGHASLVVPAIATSDDGGRTSSSPVRLQYANVWSMVLSPVVLSDGRVGFGFVDYAVDARSAGSGVTMLRTPRVWWTSSPDGGVSFLAPVPVAEVASCNDQPGNVVDRASGPFDVGARWPAGDGESVDEVFREARARLE